MSFYKPGMEKIDREKIQKIVEANTGENYGAFKKKREERLEKQKEEIREKLARLSDEERERSEAEMAALCASLEESRDLSRCCVHVDMDAFFAAVEMRDNPRLRNVPMAVGGTSMLSTSNYAARQSGVCSAMPGFIALKLCPQLEIVPGRYDQYSKESKVISRIFADYDPDHSMASLDEAYIDLTAFMTARTEPVRLKRIRYGEECECRLPLCKDTDSAGMCEPSTSERSCTKCGRPSTVIEDEVEFGMNRGEVVREMRFRVEQATGLTCSAGIAPNFMLAKVCSNKNKPNGQYELANDLDKVRKFVEELPIRKVSGIGGVSEAQLNACGIYTCGDILTFRSFLPHVFLPSSYHWFLRVGLGLGSFQHGVVENRKSISVERSFSPSGDRETLRGILRDICTMLVKDAASSNIKGAAGLGIKVKLASFDVFTRAAKVPGGSDLLKDTTIFSLTAPLLEATRNGKEVRLIGVRLYKLNFEGKRILEMLRKRPREEEGEAGEGEGGEESEEGGKEEGEGERGKEGGEGPSEGHTACPVCTMSLRGLDDREINMHVDECLNRREVKRLMVDDAKMTSPPVSRNPRKRQRKIDSFFTNANKS